MNLALLLLSLLDLFSLPKPGQLECSREIPEKVERGEAFPIVLSFKNNGTLSIYFRCIDSLPPSFHRPFPIRGEVGRGSGVNLAYETMGNVRGNYLVDKVYFRYRSSLGLWERQKVFEIPQQIPVIPNLDRVRGYLASTREMLLLEGVKPRPYQAGFGEFSVIRNYAVGDDPRKINWRATARRSEMMTNVYEPEHGKQVILLLDCGRTMGVELTEGNRLERSLEALLIVAAIALNQGDYVSILAFSDDIHAYVPPGQGLSHLQRIIQQVYTLQSKTVESNFAKAFHYLETVQKRRSLILLFSDLDHFLLEDTLLPYLQPIRKRHLFLLIGIADPMVQKWIDKDPTDIKTAMVKSMAAGQAVKRKKELSKWGKMGLQAFEAEEARVVAQTVERYMEIIDRGVL